MRVLDSANVSEAVGDVAQTLHISSAAQAVARIVEGLIREPLDLFNTHPVWPSGLGVDGFPVEFVLNIGNAIEPSIRVNVDATDHRDGLLLNARRYAETVARVGHDSPDLVRDVQALQRRHLDGIPPLFRSRALHGIGISKNSRRLGVYFSSKWMSEFILKDRVYFANYLPDSIFEEVRTGTAVLEWVSYAFGLESLQLQKTAFVFSRTLSAGSGMLTCYPCWEAHSERNAHRVFEHFLSERRPYLQAYPIYTQFAFCPGEVHPTEQVGFRCEPWGWAQPAGFRRLIAYLYEAEGIILGDLYAALGVFAEYGIQLVPSIMKLYSVDKQPALNLYFSLKAAPIPEKESPSISIRRGSRITSEVQHMLQCAAAYLKRGLLDDHWSDIEIDPPDGIWLTFDLKGPCDEFASSFIASVLVGVADWTDDILGVCRWLQKRYRDAEGWGLNGSVPPDAYTTACAVRALARASDSLPNGCREALRKFRMSNGMYSAYTQWDIDRDGDCGAVEVTSDAILALLHLGTCPEDRVENGVRGLLRAQRDEGGWNVTWWSHDLLATRSVVRLFNYIMRGAEGHFSSTLKADLAASVRAARPSVSAQAIPSEPFILGTWLSCWVECGGSLNHPAIARVVESLCDQQENGGWRGGPVRRIARPKLQRPWARSDSGRMLYDLNGFITTALVIDGLHMLQSAHENCCA